MDVAIVTGMLSGALASVKSARELAKDTADLELKAKLSEVFDSLLALKENVSALGEENRSLRAQLKEKDAVEGPVPPYGYFFQKADRDYPLCPRCYQSNPPVRSFLSFNPENGFRMCKMCKYELFEDEHSTTRR